MMRWLDTDYIWKGRVYMRGESDIPEDLDIALGRQPDNGDEPPVVEPEPETEPEPEEETTPEEEVTTPEVEAPEEAEPPALALVNDATSASELTVLPGIGTAGSTILFDNRPAGGYLTFVALTLLNVALTVTPFSVDWDAVKAWTP